MPRFLGIRHAQSVFNAAGRWQGQADPPLSDEGVRQAHRLASGLKAQGLEILVSSDLARAWQTAQIVGAGLGLAPQPVPGLREMDVGFWSGLRHAEIAQQWPQDYERFLAGDREIQPGGGESRRQLRARVLEALASLRRRWPLERVGLVTHLGVLRCLAPGASVDNAGTLWLSACGPPARSPETEELSL